MCSLLTREAHITSEGNITHEVRITFRASGTHRCKTKSTSYEVLFVLEAPPGFGPGMRVLQTRALPLGHGAIFRMPYYYSRVESVCQGVFEKSEIIF